MFASDPSMHPVLRGVIALTFAISASMAHAQADKEGEQVKRLKLQMRQIQQQQQESQEAKAKAEQARAQAEQALKAQDGDLQKQRAAASGASRKATALSQELEASKLEAVRLKAELAEAKAAIELQKAQLTTASFALDKASATESRSVQERGQLTAQLQQCVAHNADLADTGLDLLARYENKGLGAVLAGSEPFLQTARVKLENLQADYKRRIKAAQIQIKETAAPVLQK